MGRKLPWKRGDGGASSPSPMATEAPQLAPPTPSVPERKTPRKSINTTERLRSPSTSPPPEPPPESFMIPGAHHDDKYRMVEDEFLSTAQRFTAHLHRAEYNRLKSIAKTQNAAAIREIERPVVGSPTKVAKQRRELQKRTLKQRDELGDEHGGSSSSRGGGGVSSGLRGLMESPRKQSRSIRPFAQTTTNTRAAAGFASRGASPTVQSGRGSASLEKRQSDTDADEDLKAGATPRRATTSSSKILSSSTKAGRPISTTPATNRRTSQLQSEQVFIHDDDHDNHDDKEDDDDDPFGIRKRRIRREKSREQLRKTENPKPTKSNDVMPTFL